VSVGSGTAAREDRCKASSDFERYFCHTKKTLSREEHDPSR
jgi:hypothetical protein